MIIHTHPEAIFEFCPIKEELPDEFRKFIRNFMENTIGLEGMGLDVGPGDDAQSMDNLDQFLEDRARALEA